MPSEFMHGIFIQSVYYNDIHLDNIHLMNSASAECKCLEIETLLH